MTETQSRLLDKLDDKIFSKTLAVEELTKARYALEAAERKVKDLGLDIQYILDELRKAGKEDADSVAEPLQ